MYSPTLSVRLVAEFQEKASAKNGGIKRRKRKSSKHNMSLDSKGISVLYHISGDILSRLICKNFFYPLSLAAFFPLVNREKKYSQGSYEDPFLISSQCSLDQQPPLPPGDTKKREVQKEKRNNLKGSNSSRPSQ